MIIGISSKKVREDLERKVKDDPTESLGLCNLTSFSVLTGRLQILLLSSKRTATQLMVSTVWDLQDDDADSDWKNLTASKVKVVNELSILLDRMASDDVKE